ncbi:hypothetical protein QL285_096312 [Trifolium repens]|jgi:hypothetical protein|nr:hypothetical protein QL285_096312 [Trifolium repens]
MKDVASVMVNSRINKQVRKAIDYNIEKLSSYADLIVHNDKNLDLDAPIVDDLVEVGEASGGANGLRFLMLMKMDMEMSLMRVKIIWRRS